MADNEVNVRFGGTVDGSLTSSAAAVTASTRGFSKSLMADMAAYENAASAAANTANAAAGAATKLNFATAGATREFIVLGREALTGNFSRIPGTLVTLANRTGGLQTIMASVTGTQIAWVAAIAATVAVLYEWMSAEEALRETQSTVATGMQLVGRSASYNADQVARNVLAMREFESISSTAAEQIVEKFSRIPNVTSQMQAQLVRFVDAWQRITGAKDSEKAAEDMAKVFTDPAKGAEELSKKFPDLVTAQQAWRIAQDEARNGSQHAAEVLLQLVSPALQRVDNDVQQNIGTWEHFKRILTDVTNLGITTPGSFNLGERQLHGTPGDEDQDAQVVARQQHQLDLNAAMQKAFEISKTIHAEDDQINTLSEKRLALVKGINAAQETGDTDVLKKYQTDLKVIDDEILKEKKRMNAEATADAKKAVQQQLEVERERANTTRELNDIEFQQKRSLLQAEVDEGKITKQEELQQLVQLEQQEYNLTYEGYLNELKNAQLTASEKQRIWGELQVAYAKHLQQLAQLDTQYAQAQKEQDKKQVAEVAATWKEGFDQIDRAMDGLLQGTLQGTEKWQVAVAKLYSSLALSVIEDIAKMTVKWLAWQALQAAAPGSSAAKAVGGMIPQALGGTAGAAGTAAQTANTTALTALTAHLSALLAALGLNTDTTLTATQANALGTVSTDANTVSTDANALSTDVNTTTQEGGILAWIANTAATASNTIATLVEAAMASFDVGTSAVPHDMVAKIHKGEMILPPDVSAAVRSGNTTIGAGPSGAASVAVQGGGVTGGSNVSISVTALDGKSVATLLNNPSILRQLSKSVGGYMANNPSTRGSY